jgi:hypothetical protein
MCYNTSLAEKVKKGTKGEVLNVSLVCEYATETGVYLSSSVFQ